MLTCSAAPCRQYLDQEVALSEDTVHKYSDVVLAKLNKTIGDLRRVFLVEDLVDSIKVSLKARVSLQVSRSSAHSSPRVTRALRPCAHGLVLFETVLMSSTCTDLLRVQVSVQAALQLSGAVVASLSPSHPRPAVQIQICSSAGRRAAEIPLEGKKTGSFNPPRSRFKPQECLTDRVHSGIPAVLPVVVPSISHCSSRSLNVTRVSVSLQPEMARFTASAYITAPQTQQHGSTP